MSFEHAILLVVNGLSLSGAVGLIFVLLIQPGRSRLDAWFSVFLAGVAIWAYFALARVFPDLSSLSETHNFYALFIGLMLAPVALFGFTVTLCKPRDGLAPALTVWGVIFWMAASVLVWANAIVRYTETGADRVAFAFKPLGIVVALHLAFYLLLSFFYLHISANPAVKPLRLPVVLMMIGYASNLYEPLRVPPLGIGLLAAGALSIGYTMLRWQLFNPLREVREELRVANSDLRQATTDADFERKRADRLAEEVQEINRYKTEFLTDMGHRLRTPLNSIVGYSELLLDGTYGEVPQRQRDRIEKVHRNGLGLLGLINDVLDLSKLEGGRLSLTLSPVRPAPLIETLVDVIRPKADSKGLVLEITINAPLRLIRADEVRVRQIGLNLLDNAVRFTERGRVRISACNLTVKNGRSAEFALPVTGWLADREWLLIAVEDTGVGIAPEDQALIFETFYQGTNAQGEGAGLGLALARRLVELHAGRIWVHSVPGTGSTFYMALPALDQFDTTAQPAE